MNPGSIPYIGEHLLPGQIGHFCIILSFVAALFSGFCFLRAALSEGTNPAASLAWKRIARSTFVIHTAAVIGIFATLYFIITNHLFEYRYAWQHTNRALPTKYLLSSFWEGQEGSFMLWAFWHSILGCIVMGTARGLESRVMTVVSLVQVCLASMLLGFYITPDFKIGSTPFILLRHTMDAPIFSDPNYLANYIHDGNGLNVLLQNYWMVIHPPVLFLGFASVLIPFSFVIAALWKGEYQSFIKPTTVWSLFSGGVLGLGIMMGGAWAYESLNFGGYWAWDPVENASLVPWLLLVAGLHLLVVYRATGRALSTTLVFYGLAYALVWYSTFLTRTGVLGDTSVHAFTGEGKSLYWHLLVVLGMLIVLCGALLWKRWKNLPRIRNEEASSSREFWMTIGSFVLLISAAHIIFATSTPIWGPLAQKISGKLPAITDPIEHYNSIQVWIGIMVGLLSAFVLYLKFKQSDMRAFWKRMCIIGGIALALTVLIAIVQKVTPLQYLLLLFAATFGLISNVYYAFGVQSGSFKKRGAALTHFGFAMILMGVLLSSYGKEVISLNTTGVDIDLGKKDLKERLKDSREHILMFRGSPVAMGNYFATFLGDSTSETDPRTFYRVRFERTEPKSKEVTERFMLYPDAFVNPKGQEGMSSNPSTRHYLTRDIFTYVSSVFKANDKGTYKKDTLHVGDSLFFSNGFLRFEAFNREAQNRHYHPAPGDMTVGAELTVHTLDGPAKKLQPLFVLRGNEVESVPDTLHDLGLYARFTNILPEQNAAIIETKQLDPKDEYIVLKAIVFPYINVLWLGIITMVVGFLLSMVNRITKKPPPRRVDAP
jgi:cytochrome c-type biogenesis protein CcmF